MQRWEELFDDIAAQAADTEAGLLADEVAERGRWESGRLGLVQRLGTLGGHCLDLMLRDGSRRTGNLADLGVDWLLLTDQAGALLVPAAALAAVRLAAVRPDPWAAAPVPPSAGQDLRVQLRRLARDRTAVHASTAGGHAVTGTVDRVAADHLEITEHPADEPRRAAGVRGVVLVAYASLLFLRLPAEAA